MTKTTVKKNALIKAVRNPAFTTTKITINIERHKAFKAACVKYSGSHKEVSAITRTLMEQFIEGVNNGSLKRGY